VGRRMRRGEVWLAEVGGKRRPVLVLTRTEVIDVRQLVTVAEITTTIRALGAEVDIDHESIGLDRRSVVNCDGLHTVDQRVLVRSVGMVDDETLAGVCAAVAYAIGC
jgi:mRNA interferase MazF